MGLEPRYTLTVLRDPFNINYVGAMCPQQPMGDWKAYVMKECKSFERDDGCFQIISNFSSIEFLFWIFSISSVWVRHGKSIDVNMILLKTLMMWGEELRFRIPCQALEILPRQRIKLPCQFSHVCA